MSLLAKSDSTGDRKLPSSGLHKAVCCDVHDLGVEETPWGPKEKVLFVWEIDENHPDFDGPHRVNKKYTNSLHEKANLSQDLESWRGRSFTPEVRRTGFDLETCIGVPALVNIVHNETDSGKWANVKALLPLPKDQEPLKVSSGYVRLKDRPADDQNTNGSSRSAQNGSNGSSAAAKKQVSDNFAAEQDLDDLPF